MKKTLFLLLLLFPAVCYAFEPVFSNGPVIGTVGASYTEAKSPEGSPLLGGSLNNGDFFDLNDALTCEGFTIKTEAQGGAFSYDFAGWRGIQGQVDRVLEYNPLWPDRLRIVHFSLLNDCLHSVPCTEEDMDLVTQRVYDAAFTAHEAGKDVVINAYPEWESLHLAEATALYGIPYSISESDYRILQAKQKAKFENVEWIHFIYPWAKASEFPDGLHPGSDDMKKAADIIGKEFKVILK